MYLNKKNYLKSPLRITKILDNIFSHPNEISCSTPKKPVFIFKYINQ